MQLRKSTDITNLMRFPLFGSARISLLLVGGPASPTPLPDDVDDAEDGQAEEDDGQADDRDEDRK